MYILSSTSTKKHYLYLHFSDKNVNSTNSKYTHYTNILFPQQRKNYSPFQTLSRIQIYPLKLPKTKKKHIYILYHKYIPKIILLFTKRIRTILTKPVENFRSGESGGSSASGSRTSLSIQEDLSSPTPWKHPRRRASTFNEAHLERTESGSPKTPRKRSFSFHEQPVFGRGSSVSRKSSSNEETPQSRKSSDKQEGEIALPPPCTCPYFGESSRKPPPQPSTEIVIVSSDTMRPISGKNLEAAFLGRSNSGRMEGSRSYELNSVVTWRGCRRGSSLGGG